jgi:type IV pilus assembly protein PilM
VSTSIFYKDKPVFGFDVGHSSLKLMQIEPAVGRKKDAVIGYGAIEFKPEAVKNGVLVDPEEIARQAYKLITKSLIGSFTTKRVAAALPVAFTFSRVVSLPPMERKDMSEAIHLEAEQSIPVSSEQLYIDYEVVRKTKEGQSEVLMVAAPKNIVDSYMQLFKLLGLEVALLETTINSVTRIVTHADKTDAPTLIIDFGSISSDLAVYDQTIRVTGTADWGGETLTQEIAKALKVNNRQAYTIKTRYGFNPGKKQNEIMKSLEPVLGRLMNEIKRMTRFYQERASDKQEIEQIIILGGGANLPGMSTYLTDKLRVSTRLVNPWQNLTFGGLQPPHKLESTLYTTAAGLSLINKKGFYK